MARRREYNLYPLDRIVMGVTRIRNRNKPGREKEDIRCYLLTFGFNDTEEFRSLVAGKTSEKFSRSILTGTFPRRVETRARKRRKREYAEFIRNNL
jgi:hypothetical protein